MKFRYVGEEYTEWFGFKWMTGTVHDVTDEHAVKKLSGSAHFEKVGGSDPSFTITASGGEPRPARVVRARTTRKTPEQET